MRRIFFFLYILNNEVNIIGKLVLALSRLRPMPNQLRYLQPRLRYSSIHSDSVLISVLQPAANQTQTYRYTLASVFPSTPSVALGTSFLIQPFKNLRCLPSSLMPSTSLPAQCPHRSSSLPSLILPLAGPRCASISGPPLPMRCRWVTLELGI